MELSCKQPFAHYKSILLMTGTSLPFLGWFVRVINARKQREEREAMQYDLKKVSENVYTTVTEEGYKVTFKFLSEDNPDIEDIVTDNLMTAYERRIKEQS